jgi:hypothetical protein
MSQVGSAGEVNRVSPGGTPKKKISCRDGKIRWPSRLGKIAGSHGPHAKT